MGFLIYAAGAVITFFTAIFFAVKICGPLSQGDLEDPEEFMPILGIILLAAVIWPLTLPLCLLFGTGWLFLKSLSKERK